MCVSIFIVVFRERVVMARAKRQVDQKISHLELFFDNKSAIFTRLPQRIILKSSQKKGKLLVIAMIIIAQIHPTKAEM